MRRLLGTALLLFGFITVLAPDGASQTLSPPVQNTQPATIKLPGISLGESNVASTGAATYSVPIAVPPGITGLAPKIALTYNSQQTENGLLGIGWSLSGLPTIHRCPATYAQDNFRGGINYDGNDRFCLDGQRLMAISGIYGANGTEYRTEIDSFVRVISFGVAGSGPAYFRVWTKAGEMMEFGGTEDSRIEAQGKASVRVWALNKVQDTSGNYLTVSYTEDNINGEYRPSRIDYTGNSGGGLSPSRSVIFSYATRSDVTPTYVGGSLVRTTVRLTNVQSYVGLTLVRDYRLIYETGTATGRSRLQSVTECAADGTCLPATIFNWQEGGTGFTAPQAWGTATCGVSCPTYLTGDFNGDGKTDFLYVDTTTINVYLSTGTGFTAPQNWGTATCGVSCPTYLTGDFNGDGKTDFMYVDTTTIKVYLSTGTGFTAAQNWGTATCGVSCLGYLTGDFNGDGKTDFLYVDTTTIKVYLSTGTGFDGPQNWGTATCGSSCKGYQVGDFNGDGMSDFIYVDTTTIKVYLSTGAGFTAPQNWGTYSCGTSCSGELAEDLNGDGKADFIYVDTGTIKVYLSTGAGFTAPQNWGTYSCGTTCSPNLFGDFNGDGKAEVMYVDTHTIKVYITNPPYPDLLTSITNSIGGQATIVYKPITDGSVYVKDNDAVYPNIDVQDAAYVVDTYTVSDGLGANYARTYDYGGLKTHLLGRGSLGFRWIRAFENASGVETTNTFNQSFPFTGTESTSEIRSSSGALWSQAANTWSSTNTYPSVVFPFLSRVDKYECDGQPSCIQTAQTLSYDSFGNPTQTFHLGNVGIAGDERTENTEWLVDTANWIHRPSHTTLLNAAGGLMRERWLSYDSLGRLTREESRLTGPQGSVGNPAVTHVYNAFGNRTSTTDPRGCTTTTTYDSSATYPATVTTCLTHATSFIYDARFGVVLSQTDPNNQITTSTYDLFGRLTKVTGPLDTASANGTVSHEYPDWGNPSLQRIVTKRTTQHGGADFIWSEQYFDGLGRIDQTRSRGPGGQTILTEITFDARGHVATQSAPHFSGEAAVLTQFSYDVLGRQTQVTHPDGTFATTSYVHDVITITDERGNVKRRYLDAYDRLERVDEVNGAETFVTNYQYDAAGSLTQVTNHLGHVTTTTYDLLGRKIAMSDPNMGSWQYSYDAAGNLISQIDAKGQTITFTYDLQSRLLTKRYPNTQQITWTYDDPLVPFSKGRLTRVVDLSAATNFFYDALGRVIQTQRTIDGVPRTMSQSYDALSRVTSETFPDNDSVSYSYNEAGWLSSIIGYVNSITYNARGQKTQVQYANGVATNFTYNAANFRVTQRQTSIGTSHNTVALTRWVKSWTTSGTLPPPTGFANLYRGGICVTDAAGNCVGGDATLEQVAGGVIGYIKNSTDAGTVPVYRSTCYSNTAGVCTGWGLSLDVSGVAVGYLSSTAPDTQSAAKPFIQSNGLLLQGLSGTASAYLWSAQTQNVAHTDHYYLTSGSAPLGYSSEGTTGYIDQSSSTGTVPLYRFVHSSSGHHYYSTTSDQPAGFSNEATLGYIHTISGSGLVGLYRHYNSTTGDYLLTTSATPPAGYVFQTTLGYIHSSSGPTGPMQDLTYAYDNTGNITGITDALNTGSRSFAYDALNRLTQATGNFGTSQALVTHNYAYDAIGNILQKAGITYSYTDPSHPSAVTSLSDGKTYTYDANGNTLTGANRSFVWDYDNRVASVTTSGATGSMFYDYTGIRVRKDSPSGITYFPFSGYEIDPSGTITKYIKTGNEILAAKKGNDKLFYHNDHLGGINVITDIWATRVQLVEYDPWGKVSREEGASDPSRRFTGKQLDPESGLYYYGGRYYDPELGRFISPDPFVPQPGDPQSLNRYSYVENNPVNHIDPSGYAKKKKGGFFRHLLNAIRVVSAIIFAPVAPEYTALELTSVATSYMKGKTAQMISMITGYAAKLSQVGRGFYDYFNKAGPLINQSGATVPEGTLASAQGHVNYGVNGIYNITAQDAANTGESLFGKGSEFFMRFNQSSGPIADLVKGGLAQAGVQGAMHTAILGDFTLLSPKILAGEVSINIAGHSLASTFIANALGSIAPGALTGGTLSLSASPVSSGFIAGVASHAGLINRSLPPSWLDTVTYFGRSPLLLPLGAAVSPLLPVTHPCSFSCPGN